MELEGARRLRARAMPVAGATLRALGFLALYVAAVTWLTWPLGVHIGGALLGASPIHITDALYSLWAMDWATHALTTNPWSLPNAPIYHPTPDAFFYGPSALGGLALFAPAVWLTKNPVLATNVVLIGGIALTAWTMHLVVRRWTGSDAAGMVAAATILTNAWLVRGFVVATPHFAMLAYLPLLAWMAATPATRLGQALRIVPLIVLQSLTELVYVAPGAFAVLGTLALVRLARAGTRGAGVRLLLALGLSAAILSPIYGGYLSVRRENPHLASQSVYPTVAMDQRLPSQLTTPLRGPAVFLPATLALIGLGVVAIVLRRPALPASTGWRHGALWTAVGIAISLSPAVLIADVRIPLPQTLVAPAYSVIRIPARLGVIAMIGSAILAGMAFVAVVGITGRTERLGRVARGTVRLVAAAVVIVALWLGRGADAPGPAAFQRVTPPSPLVVSALRSMPGPIVEVPVQLDFMQALAMYASTFHRRPLLNGYSSYFPAEFRDRMALVRQLPDPSAVARLRDDTGLAGVRVKLGWMPAEQREAWLAATKVPRADLIRIVADGDDIVLRVPRAR